MDVDADPEFDDVLELSTTAGVPVDRITGRGVGASPLPPDAAGD